MPTLSQKSLAGGEISPEFYAKTDIVKYQSGLRTCRNFFVSKAGGISNRAGLQYITTVKDSADTTRLIPFVFNADQTYCLEFGDEYMRVIRDGVVVAVAGVGAYDSGATYVIGDLVSSGGINYYCIQGGINKTPATETAYWYPLTGTTYEIPTPYDKDDIFDLKYIQSGDVVSIVEGGFAPRDLTRTAHTDWVLALTSFVPGVTTPTNVAVAGTGGANTYVYHVTAVDPETFEESLAGTKSQASLAAAATGAPHTITWTAVSGISQYNIYLEVNGQASYVGIAGTNSFVNDGITPDYLESPPTARNPFDGAGKYPSVVSYIQQRKVFANTNNETEKVWMSRSANFNNFTVSSPISDDDSVTFNIAGRQVNAVKNIVDIGKMLVLTSGGEWEIQGDEAGIIVPGAVNPKQISYYGSSDLPPLIIGSSVLFVQARKTIIRDLYEDLVEGLGGNDLTIFASHLFEGRTIAAWAYQQIPNSIVWVVMDDGALLGFTYLRDHKVWAWHKHDTDGLFKDVIAIPEGSEDAVYVIVEREIDGSTYQYIERMYSRYVDDIIDSVFMDSALTYDGRHTGSVTMTLSGTGWTYQDSLTLTAGSATFSSGDVGNEFRLVDATGDEVRCTVIAYINTTSVTVNPHKTVPASLQATAAASWAKAVDTLSGLGHLEGKDVSVFGDGFVVASPNNDAYTTVTVTSGAITLEKPYSVIHVGLPYISDMQTLDIDNFGGTTLAANNKLVTQVGLYVNQSRGLFGGGKPPTDDDTDPLEGLYELKARNLEGYDDPNALMTDFVDIPIQNSWNSNGRVFVRQVDPLPANILAVYPSGLVSGNR